MAEVEDAQRETEVVPTEEEQPDVNGEAEDTPQPKPKSKAKKAKGKMKGKASRKGSDADADDEKVKGDMENENGDSGLGLGSGSTHPQTTNVKDNDRHKSKTKHKNKITPAVTSPDPSSSTPSEDDDHPDDKRPLFSRKITTDGMEDMSLHDGDEPSPSQHPDPPSDLPDSSPHINTEQPQPATAPTESPVTSPTDIDDVERSHSVPAPPADEADRPTVPTRTISEGLSKKMTTGFSWFARAANRGKPATSPNSLNTSGPAFGTRRGTNASVSTLGDKNLASVRDDQDGLFAKGPSLQDRFQALRMEEEARDASDNDQTPPADSGMRSPMSSKFSETGADGPMSPGPPESIRKVSRTATTLDAKLPPGTAAGMNMGPSTEDVGPVNWDLWQNLVYEGPAAVSKTSGEELNAAIQSGIPAPIRGVVWQVLADSKSDQLEAFYRNLLGKEELNGFKSPAPSRGDSISQMPTAEKESLASSASSIRSHSSTAATSMNATSPPLPQADTPAEEDDKIPDLSRKKSADQSAQIQKLEKQIRKDLGARTAYSKYIASQGLQDGLFGVCKAYALYDESIGYAQGMNFIAMPLLFNMPEAEAFSLFVKMMSKYDLRSLFLPEMTGLHLRLYQFERLLEDYEPALYCHLSRRGVTPMLYATPWFLTLFTYKFPLQLVQRIYDLILTDGLSAVLKFGIVLMRKNAQTLLTMKDMSQLTTYLKEKLFDIYIDKSPSASSILDSGFFGLAGGVDKEVYHADALVRDACAIDFSDKTLAQYQSEFEEKTRSEKEREAELDNLRRSNGTLSSKVRNLEGRLQQQDTDHVGMASELIKTKVENEGLSDHNESLKMQVDELRKVVESQPAEVEERLKEEMQRIMARNMEVQNSNRALEDSMQEMEQELVGTKMQFAQLNAEYEDLKQKLSNIQQLLGGGAAAAAAASMSPGAGR